MTFAENLKMLRKQAGMSQEQLAEKLGVSRQAVTKWETGVGIPDIENIMAISTLFNISIDDLLSNESGSKKLPETEYLYESVMEYDVDESKRYDMKLGGAKQLVLVGYEGEKIQVRLGSNTFSTLQNDFKVKIDDIRKRIDVDVKRKNGTTEAMAKSEIDIFVQIPVQYVDIESVDKGQYEACLGFGMTHTQTMTRVVLPQAAVAAIPPIVNSAIDIIKMSSLGMTIGIQDVMGEAQLSAAVSYKTFETYIIAAAFYWILALILGKLQRIVERKIGVAYQK